MTFQLQDNEGGNLPEESRQTAGIILAAGGSERLGRPKQLCEWQDAPYVRKIIQNAIEGGLLPLIIVTGAYHETIGKLVRKYQVKIVRNPNWALGIGSSMKAGLRSLPIDCDSVMFLLSDQPQISPIMIRQLIERYLLNHAPITVPLVSGQRGNPVLFDRSTFSVLMEVQGDKGGRAVFNQFEIDWMPWIDNRVLMDVDTQDEEQALMEAFFPHSQSEISP